MKRFNEEEHPRNSEGEFISKDLQNLSAEQLKKQILSAQKSEGKGKDKFFGEEFTGFKGKDAIEKLLKEKRGHIKNAFERPEIGGIDLVWGDERGGLLHTINQRDKKLAEGKGTISGINMVMKIPEIIDKGVVDSDNKGRINIDYDGYRVGILPTIYEDKVNWIVTAMELLK